MSTVAINLNSTDIRTDIPGEVYPEGDLPQIGGGRVTLQPGEDSFRLPIPLPDLWHEIMITRKMDDGTEVKYRHIQLRLDMDHPLVVVGGANDGQPMLASFSSIPRPRGRKDDPTTLWISDLAYLIDISLGDKSRPFARGGEAGILAAKAIINRHPGEVIRLYHGLSAQCRDDKVRYIFKDAESLDTIPDPRELHGCGLSYYTRSFKAKVVQPGEPLYDEVIPCKCGAAVRGFESVERFLPPLRSNTLNTNVTPIV